MERKHKNTIHLFRKRIFFILVYKPAWHFKEHLTCGNVLLCVEKLLMKDSLKVFSAKGLYKLFTKPFRFHNKILIWKGETGVGFSELSYILELIFLLLKVRHGRSHFRSLNFQGQATQHISLFSLNKINVVEFAFYFSPKDVIIALRPAHTSSNDFLVIYTRCKMPGVAETIPDWG